MTDLVPCPLCGANEGYRLSQGSTHRWWLPVCLGCGEQIGECRSDPDLPHTALVPDRWGLADAAWNAAGKHAQGLRDEIAKLRAWLKWCLDNCDDSPEWDFGTYATDTIRTLLAGGDVPMPGGDDAALAKGPK